MQGMTYILLLLILVSCKPPGADNQLSKISSDQTNSDHIELAFHTPLPGEVQLLFECLQSGKKIHKTNLERAARYLDAQISGEVSFTDSVDADGTDISADIKRSYFRGVQIGTRVFVFKKLPSTGAADNFYQPVTWFANSILHKDKEGFIASLEDKMEYVIDAKYYEPKRIADFNNLVNTADFVFHFIPMYGGAEKVFVTGKTTGHKFLGAIEILGDAATFGLLAKYKAVKQGAAAIVIGAATVRVSAAANKAYHGQANYSDGIDAFLATVEAGLAAVTIVKVKLSGLKYTVGSADEAALLGKQLNRPADDILKNGITRGELENLIGDIPALQRHLDKADNLAEGSTRGLRAADDLTLPRICRLGLGLLQGDDDCFAEELAQAIKSLVPAERVPIILQYAEKAIQRIGLTPEKQISRINNRKIYSLGSGKKKTYYSLDTQHGEFEVLNRSGKHKGVIDIDGNEIPGKLDTSGGHDIRLGQIFKSTEYLVA